MAGTVLASLYGAAPALAVVPKAPIRGGHECIWKDGQPVLFNPFMGYRAARAIYRGTRRVTQAQDRLLALIARCQWVPSHTKLVLAYIARQKLAWESRIRSATVLWHGPDVASWYYDAGSTACGFHATYGFASLFLPCGAQITMRGPGGTVVATMEDHGPYVGGRTFDLNPALKAALGCSDLCDVYWH